MLPLNVLRWGRTEDQPESLSLRAGPLSLRYEEGGLRYIRLGDREVLRRVYVAVRDRNWGTILRPSRTSRWSAATTTFGSASWRSTARGQSTSPGAARSAATRPGRSTSSWTVRRAQPSCATASAS